MALVAAAVATAEAAAMMRMPDTVVVGAADTGAAMEGTHRVRLPTHRPGRGGTTDTQHTPRTTATAGAVVAALEVVGATVMPVVRRPPMRVCPAWAVEAAVRQPQRHTADTAKALLLPRTVDTAAGAGADTVATVVQVTALPPPSHRAGAAAAVAEEADVVATRRRMEVVEEPTVRSTDRAVIAIH